MAVEPSHVVPDNEPLFILGNTLEPGFPIGTDSRPETR